MREPEDNLQGNERLRARLQEAEDLVRALRTGDVEASVDHLASPEANRIQVSETRYRRLFEAAHDGILIVDPDTREIIDANPFMIKLLRYSLAELIGMEIFEIGLFSDTQANKDMFEILKATGQIRYENLPLQTEDGALRDVEVVANLYAENGHSVIQFNTRDITERIRAAVAHSQAEAALRESEERLRTLFDTIDEGFMEVEVEMGPEGRVVDWRYLLLNKAFGRLTGMPDVTGRLASEVAPDLEPEFAERYTQVVLTGEPVRFEQKVALIGRTFDLRLSRMGGPGSRRVAVVYDDVTARRKAEADASENNDRQAFLLKFSDALRAEPNADAKTDRAIGMLFKHMQLDRCYVGIYRLAEGMGVFPHQVHNEGLPPFPTHAQLSDFPEAFKIATERTLVIDDVAEMEGLSDIEGASFAGFGIGALITATLRKGEKNPLWAICAVSASPRIWTPNEVSLVEEVAERTWAAVERARGEERLHDSHATFRSLIDRSPFGTYIVDADFRMVQMSEGGQKAFGILRPLIGHDFSAVVHAVWPDPFASEVIAHFRHTLATGEPFKALSTERRADIDATEAYDWKIERIILPDGRAGVVCHFYDFTEKQQQEDHIKLLMGEVNHRSKNMLALIQAIARQTVKSQPEDFLEIFGQRVRALSASQDLLVKGEWKSVQLEELVRTQLAHFGDEHDGRIEIEGPSLLITASASQSLGMAVHELATNAAKFGALSNDSGRVVINWSLHSDNNGQEQFEMSWNESGGPTVAKPARRGFGSTVIDGMLKMSLGCDAKVDFAPTGLVWRIGCPAAGLVESAVPSAPRPNGISAGQENASKSGRRILIVEDESLLAMDYSQTLSDAGYSVIGPANSVAGALSLLAKSGCDAAVLDINLGTETSEPIARELIKLGTPFCTTSGYSREQVPEIMQSAPLLVKPVSSEKLVAEIDRCLIRRN